MPTIVVHPIDSKGEGDSVTVVADVGGNLLAAMLDAGVVIGNDCGGNAQCATCRVRVDACSVELLAMSMAEEYALARVRKIGVVRLACQCVVQGDMRVAVLDAGEE